MKKLLLTLLILPTLIFAKQNTLHIPTVKNFQINSYLGTWYEIARLPHKFEKNLQQVTATYSLRNDGKIEVHNRGFNTHKSKWKDALGKAWIKDNSNQSELRVSFFWPFSGAYRVIYLEPDYSLAIVTSKSYNYFWILSRSSTIEENYYNLLMEKTKNWGFDTSRIIRVKH